MNPDQFEKLLGILSKIADKQTYTLSGAADWPIAVCLVSVVIALIGLMWRDLKSATKEQKKEIREELNIVWSAMHDCQNDCCPRGGATTKRTRVSDR